MFNFLPPLVDVFKVLVSKKKKKKGSNTTGKNDT